MGGKEQRWDAWGIEVFEILRLRLRMTVFWEIAIKTAGVVLSEIEVKAAGD